MIVPFFIDGPLRGRTELLPDTAFHQGHAQEVQVARGCGDLVPYTEPATVQRAEKAWEPDKWIYRYQFQWFPILGRMVVLGWCSAALPSETAMFEALINPKVRNAVALQDEMTALATGQSNDTPGDGK